MAHSHQREIDATKTLKKWIKINDHNYERYRSV